jgi:hypothetical protein
VNKYGIISIEELEKKILELYLILPIGYELIIKGNQPKLKSQL